MRPVFLIGYRCTGKTITGKILADLLDCDFVDTDQLLESRFNISIAQMVKERGWDYFRERETGILTGLDLEKSPVVATGGGIVLAKENREFIRQNGTCVWLFADAKVLTQRICTDVKTDTQRPDLTDDSLEQETIDMLKLRTPLYEELAQITINTAEHSAKEAAQLIKRRFDNERV